MASRIAKRYGRALFSLTNGDLAKAKEQRDSLMVLKQLFQDKDGGAVLRSPVMPTDLKKQLLDYGLTQANAGDELKKLVYTVLEAGRVHVLPDVADAYAEFIDDAEGVVRAEVTSAVALKADDLNQISTALGRVLHKQADVRNEVDPSLLGGFVVRVGNNLIDMSLKTRLDGLAASAVQDSIR